jgi:putative methyltransferase (TIGR04325 family)
MNKLKLLARNWFPPVLVRAFHQIFRSNSRIYFEGDYPTWEEASALCSGYDNESILKKVLDATLKVKYGEAVYERDSVVFNKIHYAWPVTAALMWAAAQRGGRLSVLDFGGSLGSSYFQNRQFFEGLADVHWSVVEQSHFVEAGQQHIQDEHLRFYKTIHECVKLENPNIVLLSSVLQYLEKPEELLSTLLEINFPIIIVDLTIINLDHKRKIYVQKVPSSIYSASYPVWSLPEKEIFALFKANNYSLMTDFETLDFSALANISSFFKGYLFVKN